MTPPTGLERVALSVRLPAAMRDEAHRYADAHGLSVNALIALALSTYLDGQAAFQRRERFTEPHSPVLATPPAPAKPARRPPGSAAKGPDPDIKVKPPKRPRDYCPCGSTRQYRHCHGPVNALLYGKGGSPL